MNEDTPGFIVGAAAAKYVDAVFDDIPWEQVCQRFDRAQRAAATLRY